MKRAVVGAFVVVVASVACAAPASAARVTIDGSPLNVSINEFGQLQAQFDGDPAPQFDTDGFGNPIAGLMIGFSKPPDSGADWAGAVPQGEFNGFDNIGGSGPTFAGTGTSANPFTLTTTYFANHTKGKLRVVEVESYVNGDSGFTSSYTISVEPTTPVTPVRYRASAIADLVTGGDDSALGLFEAGPPRFIGAATSVYETIGGLEEIATTPWDSYQAGSLGSILLAVDHPVTSGFANTAAGGLIDTAAGVQWDDYSVAGRVAADPPVTFQTRWQFRRIRPIHGLKVVLTPVSGTVLVKAPGQPDFKTLSDPRRVEVGTLVDARNGFVDVTAEAGPGDDQTATFWDGSFEARQKTAAGAPMDAKLADPISCGGRKKKGRIAASTAGPPRAHAAGGASRRLWAKGKGSFRTTGFRGSATIRGTEWLTTDRCKGKAKSTTFKVVEGVLAIDDFTKKKKLNKVLKKGRYKAQ